MPFFFLIWVFWYRYENQCFETKSIVQDLWLPLFFLRDKIYGLELRSNRVSPRHPSRILFVTVIHPGLLVRDVPNAVCASFWMCQMQFFVFWGAKWVHKSITQILTYAAVTGPPLDLHYQISKWTLLLIILVRNPVNPVSIDIKDVRACKTIFYRSHTDILRKLNFYLESCTTLYE